ncbi:MAG: DUF4382 domain-containing protein [Prolixibacteraceae bacterium]|jgi:hypothetical protein|nr:DUF4382 domain-containing protein [Prolixibacteraceae bacterium]
MRRIRKLVFPLFLLSIIVGCNEEEVVIEDNNQTKGNLSIQLTDAPFPSDLVSEANVTINKIEVRKRNENDGNPFITLSEEERTFNLLELTNGITATLAEIEVDTGDYNLIRLYVADANIVTNDSTYNLKVPGGSASGIKILINPSVVVTSDTTSQVLLDFDVSQSFVVQGNPNTPAGIKGFIFKPTIKASNLAVSGQLTGMVTDSSDTVIQGAQVAVYTADTLHTSTLSNDAGNYTFAGLNTGNYDVTVEYNDYKPVTIEDIEVIAGKSVTQDVQLTETE